MVRRPVEEHELQPFSSSDGATSVVFGFMVRDHRLLGPGGSNCKQNIVLQVRQGSDHDRSPDCLRGHNDSVFSTLLLLLADTASAHPTSHFCPGFGYSGRSSCKFPLSRRPYAFVPSHLMQTLPSSQLAESFQTLGVWNQMDFL